MKTRICGMTLDEIERKIARFDIERREGDALDEMSGLAIEPMPDNTPKKAKKLARRLWPDTTKDLCDARTRAESLLPFTKEWKKAMRLYARLERIDEICRDIMESSSHHTM